jgi:hypothetical protein
MTLCRIHGCRLQHLFSSVKKSRVDNEDLGVPKVESLSVVKPELGSVRGRQKNRMKKPARDSCQWGKKQIFQS